MKHYSSGKVEEITEVLNYILTNNRKQRNFHAEEYVNEKLNKLDKYLGENGINTCVVALSGGIDSAIVYGLLKVLEGREESNLKEVVALTLPYYKSSGARNQKSTVKRSRELVKIFNGELIEIELSSELKKLSNKIKKETLLSGSDWSEGQLVSYLRTPTYYYVTSLLSDEGKRAVVVGTTNKDEGAYIGYFGKASDGMVDVQLISDIHKSEVYMVAEYLNIPLSILEVVPTGDMYDNRVDEEVFGASYDFVELYMNYLSYNDEQKELMMSVIREYPESLSQFVELSNNIEKLHGYNKHKYYGCSPAVHMDVLPYNIVGGWKYFNY